jgi:predicted dithiol-disulfide oxidoreductase (DUF899 family)
MVHLNQRDVTMVCVSRTSLEKIDAYKRRMGWRGAVYHTYSTYARGTDVFNTFYQLLDCAPKGRDEENIPPGRWWWRRHDEYAQS